MLTTSSCAALPWIAEAIRLGYAGEESGAIVFCPDYMETIGYNEQADTLFLDFNSESEWLGAASAFKTKRSIVFDIGRDLGYVLPLSEAILSSKRFVVISQNGVPTAPPEMLGALPLPLNFPELATAAIVPLR